jgi:hypothetical protein
MHKYAAATALVIALNITMLTPAVSELLTPLNNKSIGCRAGTPCVLFKMGSVGGRPPQCILLRAGGCTRNCQTELWYTEKLWDNTRIRNCAPQPLLEACIAKCVAAKKAAQH